MRLSAQAVILSVAAAFLASACGGRTPASPSQQAPSVPASPSQQAPSVPTDDVAGDKPAIDCSKEPPSVDDEPSEGDGEEPYSVTGPAIARGDTRTIALGSPLVSSRSEGGVKIISLHGLNACGLWLAEFYQGSESGGDADVQRTTYRLVKEISPTFEVKALGARFSIEPQPDGAMVVVLLEAIPEYIGE